MRKPVASTAASDPYRVMVVDDSAVIRGMVSRWLKDDPAVSVVGTASNGVLALKDAEKHKPEVVVLDIEMPEMDGMTALPKLLKIDPDMKIIMASTLTTRNAEISLQALANGAADYIPKPGTSRDAQQADDFQRLLIEKIKALGAARRLKPRRGRTVADKPAASAEPAGKGIYGESNVTLRRASPYSPKVLAVGSSTGGPQALFEVLGYLKSDFKLPILITQHMPPTFTKILAEHISRITGGDCHEAVDGEKVVPGTVYIAPGDWHMLVEKQGADVVIRLNQAPPENFCRPAVDPMFRSIAEVYGKNTLAVILTGMGHDGLQGGGVLIEAGGSLIAQDEASSVVWGMPGAVATGGLCSAVVPLTEVGPTIERMVAGGAQ
ncbi:MAG: chemotaxis response regulator protein-glutamate methylesterase [Minwuiales bacterium]|nr:chemotaxis response regulator protein-glutamate methylesterase [Minwuiales bacterium]